MLSVQESRKINKWIVAKDTGSIPGKAGLTPAYTNNEINSEINHETYTCFSAVVAGATHRTIDELYICPPNIILELFRLLVIPYSWDLNIVKLFFYLSQSIGSQKYFILSGIVP